MSLESAELVQDGCDGTRTPLSHRPVRSEVLTDIVGADPIGSASSTPPALKSSSTADPTAIISRAMRGLSSSERSEVLRRLRQESNVSGVPHREVGSHRHWIARFLALCCVVLIPWTVGLGLTLPRDYLVGNWPLAWVGFDVVLLGCLAVTAWALWRQRQIAVPMAMVTAALLLCDAWFDIVTAHTGRCLIVSIATAAMVELPIAALLGLTSIRLFRVSVIGTRDAEAMAELPPLWRTPLVASTVETNRLGVAGAVWSDEVRQQRRKGVPRSSQQVSRRMQSTA